MSENLRWYTKALYQFDHVVRLVPDDGWDRPSSCDGWTARHVLGHVNAIQRYIEASVRGTAPPMNPMEDPDRHAGSNPQHTWAKTRDAVLESLDHSGALARVVKNYKDEDEVIDDMIGFNVGDTTIHAWDLAHAARVDDALDDGLVARVTAIFEPRADFMRVPMIFGPRVPVGDDATAQTKLLGLTGRRAR